MVLIKCPECGKEISDRAVSCPCCGFPIDIEKAAQQENAINSTHANNGIPKVVKKRRRLSTWGWALIIVGTLLLALAVSAVIMFFSNDMNGYEKTENGLYYRFEQHNLDAQKVQEGDMLVGELTISLDTNVISTNVGKSERIMLVEPSCSGILHEGLLMMHNGDRAIFAIEADSIAKKMPDKMPSIYEKGKGMKFYYAVNLQGIVTKAELEAERLEQERLEQERLERERLEQERLERERLEQERLEQQNYSWMNGEWHLSCRTYAPMGSNSFRVTLKINSNNHSIRLIDETTGEGYKGTYTISESDNIIYCDGNCVHFDPNKQLFYERIPDEWGFKRKVYYHKR